MRSLSAITKLLGYQDSEHFRTQTGDFETETVQYFRLAREKPDGAFQVKGFYVFRTGDDLGTSLPAKPAVCLAEAETAADARKLHRRIWNLGYIPFLVVRLPNEIRVYSGFSYREQDDVGLLLTEASSNEAVLLSSLGDFTSQSIDSGHIWQTRKSQLETRERVNATLLENLKQLSSALTPDGSTRLGLDVAHALIGKFVYLRYLRDRNILDDEWLAKHRIDIDRVFGPDASLQELIRLDAALESRFNGGIFQIDFGKSHVLEDSHVQLVASVFAGDKIHASEHGFVRQLHLRFKAYDFRHIPVETLSSIYEQFLHAQQKGRKEGAFYTPEVLADYLLSEIATISKLTPGVSILDPACGSGVFLVLAYRRLIELELAATGKQPGEIEPMRLRDILTQSIFGVERQPDACNVTVFSLILTMLHYIDPPELHANEKFKFPALLNTQIFCDDFFNPDLQLPARKSCFEFIVGNPPWIELKPSTVGEDHARQWIKGEPSIAGNRVSDAFALRAGRLLSDEGVAGMVLPASSLFTLEGTKFRRKFFTEFSVARITNFANLRANLFGGRAMLPTATIVFRNANEKHVASPILHYGPFAVDQVAGDATELWLITIHGNDVQPVTRQKAATGETSVWKLALWGTQRDVRSLQDFSNLYPLTLAEFCRAKGWGEKLPRQGAEIRRNAIKQDAVPTEGVEDLEYCEELRGKLRFDTETFNAVTKNEALRFYLPDEALVSIPDDYSYIRTRGGRSGLEINKPPHLLIPAAWKNFLLYSEKYFAVPPRQMAIACPEKNSEVLRALTAYLACSLVDYFVFFHVPEWGVYNTMTRVVQRVIRTIPTPDFTAAQVAELADFHRELVKSEEASYVGGSGLASSKNAQKDLDDRIFEILQVPEHLRVVAEDFRDTRLPLDKGADALKTLGRKPTNRELNAYGHVLRDELNQFLMGEAQASVTLLSSEDLVCCEVKVGSHKDKHLPIVVRDDNDTSKSHRLLAAIRNQLTEKFSQWVYQQRNLLVWHTNSVQMFKPPRAMDWTRTRALSDADEIIADILSRTEPI